MGVVTLPLLGLGLRWHFGFDPLNRGMGVVTRYYMSVYPNSGVKFRSPQSGNGGCDNGLTVASGMPVVRFDPLNRGMGVVTGSRFGKRQVLDLVSIPSIWEWGL